MSRSICNSQRTTMFGKPIPKPSEIDTETIVRSNFKKLSTEHQSGFKKSGKRSKKRWTKIGKKCEDKAM
jgi:hypothetical protein